MYIYLQNSARRLPDREELDCRDRATSLCEAHSLSHTSPRRITSASPDSARRGDTLSTCFQVNQEIPYALVQEWTELKATFRGTADQFR